MESALVAERSFPEGADFRTQGEPQRLDRALCDALECGRRAARALIQAGRVFVDDRPVRAGARLVPAGSYVRLAPLDREGVEVASTLPLAPRVLCDAGDLLVLDKPAGMHTHVGASSTSVARWLLELRPQSASCGASPREAGLVHRLDRDTSGVVLAAADRATYDRLRRDFARRLVEKTYLAIVAGKVTRTRTIDQPLVRRKTRVAPAHGRERRLDAFTLVEPLEQGPGWTLVRASMRTGVTHQVRAHLALDGHAILGDAKYGGPTAPSATRAGQLLHALSVELADGRAFAAPTAADFQLALSRLRRERDRP